MSITIDHNTAEAAKIRIREAAAVLAGLCQRLKDEHPNDSRTQCAALIAEGHVQNLASVYALFEPKSNVVQFPQEPKPRSYDITSPADLKKLKKEIPKS